MYEEYQIRAALISAIKEGLEARGVVGYDVLAYNAPLMTHGDKAVLVHNISTVRQGFQSGKFVTVNEDGFPKIYETEVWLEEIRWQISAIRKRRPEDDVGTQTANDVIKLLVSWLNSAKGAEAMRGRTDVPFAPVYAKAIESRDYEDDSDIHQQEERADFKIIVVQSLKNDGIPLNCMRGELFGI